MVDLDLPTFPLVMVRSMESSPLSSPTMVPATPHTFTVTLDVIKRYFPSATGINYLAAGGRVVEVPVTTEFPITFHLPSLTYDYRVTSRVGQEVLVMNQVRQVDQENHQQDRKLEKFLKTKNVKDEKFGELGELRKIVTFLGQQIRTNQLSGKLMTRLAGKQLVELEEARKNQAGEIMRLKDEVECMKSENRVLNVAAKEVDVCKRFVLTGQMELTNEVKRLKKEVDELRHSVTVSSDADNDAVMKKQLKACEEEKNKEVKTKNDMKEEVLNLENKVVNKLKEVQEELGEVNKERCNMMEKVLNLEAKLKKELGEVRMEVAEVKQWKGIHGEVAEAGQVRGLEKSLGDMERVARKQDKLIQICLGEVRQLKEQVEVREALDDAAKKEARPEVEDEEGDYEVDVLITKKKVACSPNEDGLKNEIRESKEKEDNRRGEEKEVLEGKAVDSGIILIRPKLKRR